ncbi:unnamed protein product [Closterium sp. NIES-64]|nr:unnamed protein product [Closterium sp. NIES-64]
MHQLVTLMGGHVACLSYPGIGSTFAFSAPFSSPPSPLAPATAVTHPPTTITCGTTSAPGQPLGEEGANGGEDGENGGEEGEEDKIWPEDMRGSTLYLHSNPALHFPLAPPSPVPPSSAHNTDSIGSQCTAHLLPPPAAEAFGMVMSHVGVGNKS